jgi:mono/diheme cytochrome c family protein
MDVEQARRAVMMVFARGLCALGFIVLAAACAAPRRQAAVPPADLGQIHFRSYCAACHQEDGTGDGEAPPLAGSPWVAGSQDRLIRIVLHGIRGPMTIQGKTYNLEMPGFGQVLSDTEVAALLSFVRKRFGSAGDVVAPSTVSRVRAAHLARSDYWSTVELEEDE